MDLIKISGVNIVKYALALMDALFTDDELKTCSFIPVGKLTSSLKPPLSPRRMKLLEGINSVHCIDAIFKSFYII